MKHDRAPAEALLRVLASARGTAGRVRFAPPGTSGTRRGAVAVERREPHCVILRERGRFLPDGGREIPYTDALRFERRGGAVDVGHLRHDPMRPVRLVRLEPHEDGTLASVAAHRCGDDAYALVARVRDDAVELEWTVRGPGKRGSIRVTYGPDAAGADRTSDCCTEQESSGRFPR